MSTVITDSKNKIYNIVTEWDYNQTGQSYCIYASTQIPSLIRPLMEMALEKECETQDWLKGKIENEPELVTINYTEGDESFELFIEECSQWFMIKIKVTEPVMEIAA